MDLWIEWYQCVKQLRVSCSRKSTFMWLVLSLVGISIRIDCLGVTSFVRAMGLKERCYKSFLHLFHSSALKLDILTDCWVKLTLVLFKPLNVAGYIILVVDGIKVAKEGKKMPSVKKLHQESSNNSKPEYIWGHSFQSIAMLVDGIKGTVFAVPIVSRIHEGVIFSNRDKRTLMDKMVVLFFSVIEVFQERIILAADNYYANKKVIKPLIIKGVHLVARIRNNAVAYYLAKPSKTKTGAGRKKKYGCKVKLLSFFNKRHLFVSASSPVYGENDVTISYFCINLLWRPIGQLIRFVLVDHPIRGKVILMTTVLDLDPLKLISIYGYRFKIEVSFKEAANRLQIYSYHFWMKVMSPLKRLKGNQHVHKKSSDYRDQIIRKINAYHTYVQIGCIAHGLLLHLSINFGSLVWRNFRSWLRTMKKDLPPSELVVSYALRTCLPEFLIGTPKDHPLEKFIIDNSDPELIPSWGALAA